jgi:hypothetical protein
MQPTNKTARLAAVLYLASGLLAPFSLLYVPGKLIVRGNAAATAQNILQHETLFRVAILFDLFSTIVLIFLAMVLYRLLNNVNRMQASLMVILVLVSIPVSLFSIISEFAALIVVRGPEYLSVFAKPQLDALAMLFLQIRGRALLVAQIFWGLWLIPFGLLVMRSGFIPRILGALLIINGFAYPAASLSSLLLPIGVGVLNPFLFVAELGELWIMLWLLIKGAKVEPAPAPAVVAR